MSTTTAPERTSTAPRTSDSRFPAATLGTTLLRVVLGVTFLLHGWQKFTEWTVAGTQAAFAQMGVPLAYVNVYLMALMMIFLVCLLLLLLLASKESESLAD